MADCWKDFSFDYEFLLSENFLSFLLDRILLLEDCSIYLLYYGNFVSEEYIVCSLLRDFFSENVY